MTRRVRCWNAHGALTHPVDRKEAQEVNCHMAFPRKTSGQLRLRFKGPPGVSK